MKLCISKFCWFKKKLSGLRRQSFKVKSDIITLDHMRFLKLFWLKNNFAETRWLNVIKKSKTFCSCIFFDSCFGFGKFGLRNCFYLFSMKFIRNEIKNRSMREKRQFLNLSRLAQMIHLLKCLNIDLLLFLCTSVPVQWNPK